VPYPLRHVPNGMYQLELHPAAGEPALLAKTPFFSIKEKTIGSYPSPVCLGFLVDLNLALTMGHFSHRQQGLATRAEADRVSTSRWPLD